MNFLLMNGHNILCRGLVHAFTHCCLHYCNKKLSYRGDSAGRRALRRSRSFEVTDFGTNRKPVCVFLLVNNTNLHPVSHRLPDIAQYRSDYRF